MLAQAKNTVQTTRKKVIGQRLTGKILYETIVNARVMKVRTRLDQNTFLVDMVPPQIKDLSEHFIIFRTGYRDARKLWEWPLVLCWFCPGTRTAGGMARKDR